MTQPKQRRDLILHRPERALADEFGMTLEEVQQVLDEHPVERDRDTYLRRALAQQLLLLDRLEVTFGRMAFEDHDTAAGALLVKCAERKATLLGLNAPIGHAVRGASRDFDRSNRTRAQRAGRRRQAYSEQSSLNNRRRAASAT